MALLKRVSMGAVGLVVFAGYAAAGVGTFLLWRWLLLDPPSLSVLVPVFLVSVLLGGYVAYRRGATRLVASLDARRIPPARAPELYRRLERLCASMSVETPPVLVADLGAPNALSIGGPRRGVVVLDDDLLRLLTIDELEGILAHELAHMEGYDTAIQTLILTAARSLVSLVFLLFLPVVLVLTGIDRGVAWALGQPQQWRHGLSTLFWVGIQVCLGVLLSLFTLGVLAYSRRREFVADRRAGTVSGKPVALARALVKIDRASKPRRGLLSFLYVQRDRTDESRRLLSTHPPVSERVERLLDIAEESVSRHRLDRLRR
jgi:heat shock protein HtpX